MRAEEASMRAVLEELVLGFEATSIWVAPVLVNSAVSATAI